MTGTADSSDERRFVSRAIEASIRIAVIAVLVFATYPIVSPFVVPIVWGVIIAVALFPTFAKIEKWLGGRKGLAATLVVVITLLILLVPALLLADTLMSGVQRLSDWIGAQASVIPPPPAGVESWPIIGKNLAGLWTLAADNLGGLLEQFTPELEIAGKWLLSVVADLGLAVIMLVASIIIAGVLLAYSEGGGRFARRLAVRLAGNQGEDFVRLAGTTVRSVALGVLGVAAIQSVLAGLGFLVAGIPGAGLWAFLCLVLGVIQIGPFPVLVLTVVYMFATAEMVPAILFTVWAVVVGVSDNALKPLLLGRGVDAPMIVVLIGSLGGMITSGVVGLFVGAVIVSLAYRLFNAWLEGNG